MRRCNWLPYHCRDWQDKSDGAHVSSPQTLMKVMNGHEKITPAQSLSWLSSLAHQPPSLSPTSVSIREIHRSLSRSMSTWSIQKWYEGIARGRRERADRYVAHKSVSMSQGWRRVGELSLFLCDSQVYPVVSPPFYLLRLADNQKRWVVYNI